MQASVERYSLKDMERFAGYLCEINLQEASEARRKLGAVLNLKMLDRITDDDKQIVEVYNKDDCLATLKLHQWLESICQEQVGLGAELTRPELKTGDASETVDEKDDYARRLYEQLIDGLPGRRCGLF